MGRAVLTEEQVLEARRLHATGKWTAKALSIKFGIHPTTIQNAVNGGSWEKLPFFLPVVCEVCKETYDTEGGHQSPRGQVDGVCPDCE